MQFYKKIPIALTLALIALWTAACQGGSQELSPYGHQPEGIYILHPHETDYTCKEFSGSIAYSVNEAFEKTSEGNRRAVLTVASNLLAVGMGSLPRGFELGLGMRAAGKREMIKAMELDRAARDKGCPGADIIALVEERLGEGEMAKVIAEAQEKEVKSILVEERKIKGQVR